MNTCKGLSVLMLLCAISIHVLTGCSDSRPVATQSVAHDTSAAPDPAKSATLAEAAQVKEPGVITGTFVHSYYSPLNDAVAEVAKLGENKYHLKISVARGLSHHLGDIESDFSFDGKTFLFSDELYKDVTLSFAENALTVDYPNDGFGGFNAEPRGTYYLKNSGAEDAPFLTKLFDAIKLDESYRNGYSDVYTYPLDEHKNLLLLRSRSGADRSFIAREHVVIHHHKKSRFTAVGEVVPSNIDSIRETLKQHGVDEELIYEVTRKTYNDRHKEVLMKRFDDGNDSETITLTDEEAFFIVTGIEHATHHENNARDENNIGSIFVQEIEHSDDNRVLIRIYEVVRNDETDTHNATSDLLEINRKTGRIASTIFEAVPKSS